MTDIPQPNFVQIVAAVNEHVTELYALDSRGNVWQYTGSGWVPLRMERKTK